MGASYQRGLSYIARRQSLMEGRWRLMVTVSILLHLLFMFGIELEQVTAMHGKPAMNKPLSLVLQTNRSPASITSLSSNATRMSAIKVTPTMTAQPVNQTLLATSSVQPQHIAKKTVRSHQYRKVPVIKPIPMAQANVPNTPVKTLEPLPPIGIPVIAAQSPEKPRVDLPDTMDNPAVIGIPVQTPALPLPMQKILNPASTMIKPTSPPIANKAEKTLAPVPMPAKQQSAPPAPMPVQAERPVAVPVPIKQPTIVPPASVTNTLKAAAPEPPVAIPEPIKPAPITPPVPMVNEAETTVVNEPIAIPFAPSQSTVSEPSSAAPKAPPSAAPATATKAGADLNDSPHTSATAQSELLNKPVPVDNNPVKPESNTPEPPATEKTKNGFPKRLTGNMDQLMSRDWNAVMQRTIRATTEPEGSYAEQQEKLRKKSASLVFRTQHDYSNLSGQKNAEIKKQKMENAVPKKGDCDLGLKATAEQDEKTGKRQPSASSSINCNF